MPPADAYLLPQVHKMFGQLFIFLFLIGPSLSCSLSDLQEVPDNVNPDVAYIPDGEPFFVRCPHEPPESKKNYSITWFKNGSHTEISTDIQSRIHQDRNYLKFFPARLEDSGFYFCIYRDAEECWKELLTVDVFQNDNDLCYKKEALYKYDPVFEGSLTIECPFVPDLVNSETTQFFWFKECMPLDLTTDTTKYFISSHILNIDNMTPQDSGYYKCVTSLIHNGTKYNISRSINYTIHALPLVIKPVISYPTDNFIEAELGAPFTVTCQALFCEQGSLSWMVNNSDINDYFDDGRVTDGQIYDAVNKDGEKVICQNLTFSSIKEEDYGIKVYCIVMSFPEYTMAFFKLKQPGPNFQGFLIAIFVSAAFFIVTTVIIIKVFKVDIVLWYRSSGFSHPHQNDGKIYDAYIMYPRNAIGNCAYDMDLFVLKLLPEVLENQCAYRLFIIGRDDLPGQAMADLVDKAISQSRRLIIVLGQVSNQTNLGEDFEQKIAMYDALIRNKTKVILIEMEKITDYTFMPESIKYIRQKQGVVRWKDTFTEASLSRNTRFWKNIRYRMPPIPCHSDENFDFIAAEDI